MLAVAGLLTGVLGTLTASASHPELSLPGSSFEIDTDANLRLDDPAPSKDWASVTETRKPDSPSGSGDESFGQGTKEDTAVPTVVSGSIPPNKSDLKSFGLYQEGSSSAGFLHLYWTRVQDPTGTTNMDFEFNQSRTPSSNGVTPVRTAGDLLITYDLSNGGTVATISRRTWTGSEWGPATSFDGSTATGSINTSAIPAAQADGLGALSARTFGEASIRLSAVLPTDECRTFGSAYLKSRASDTFSSALKDFVPPQAVNVTNCGSVKIVKKDDAGAVLAGAGFTLYKDNAPVGGTRGTEDVVTAYTCTTGADGTCTMTGVFFGTYWVVEATVPPGHVQAPDAAIAVVDTTVVVVNLVDPRIILQPTITTAQRFVPNDSATVRVGSADRGDLAGTVVFKLFNNTACSGTPLYTSGAISIASGTGSGTTRTVRSSNTRAFSTSMTFSWLVTFTSTNSGHLDVTSICDDEHSSIAIDNNHIAP